MTVCLIFDFGQIFWPWVKQDIELPEINSGKYANLHGMFLITASIKFCNILLSSFRGIGLTKNKTDVLTDQNITPSTTHCMEYNNIHTLHTKTSTINILCFAGRICSSLVLHPNFSWLESYRPAVTCSVVNSILNKLILTLSPHRWWLAVVVKHVTRKASKLYSSP